MQQAQERARAGSAPEGSPGEGVPRIRTVLPKRVLHGVKDVCGVDFSALTNPQSREIPLTEHRAITLAQLKHLMRHTEERLNSGEVWMGKRYKAGGYLIYF